VRGSQAIKIEHRLSADQDAVAHGRGVALPPSLLHDRQRLGRPASQAFIELPDHGLQGIGKACAKGQNPVFDEGGAWRRRWFASSL
jgi:hypothetical protein